MKHLPNHILSSAALLVAFLAPLSGQEQNFEIDQSGVDTVRATGEFLNPVLIRRTSVDSFFGVGGAGGSNTYLEVDFYGEDGSGFFAVQGDRATYTGNAPTGFVSGQRQSVSVYIDDPDRVIDPTPGNPNSGDESFAYFEEDGWFWSSTVYDETNTFFANGGGFGVQLVYDSVADAVFWEARVDGNDGGFAFPIAGSPAPYQFASGSSPQIGWFTFETSWVEDTDGTVDQMNRILNDSGSEVYAAMIPDVFASTLDVGGLGVQSIGSGNYDFNTGVAILPENGMQYLGVDNFDAVIPEASALIFFCLGAAILPLQRRRKSPVTD